MAIQFSLINFIGSFTPPYMSMVIQLYFFDHFDAKKLLTEFKKKPAYLESMIKREFIFTYISYFSKRRSLQYCISILFMPMLPPLQN